MRQVNDAVADNAYGSNSWEFLYDIDNQTDTSNYVYDQIGNLIQDKKEQINSIKWNVYGKITEIIRTSTTPVKADTITYFYDALGNRIGKNYDENGVRRYTWYVRDAQGNILSIYENTNFGHYPTITGLSVTQKEQYYYGSSRLGFMHNAQPVDGGPQSMAFYSGGQYQRGWKQYELTNHLGNVLAVISDKKFGVSSGGSLNDYYNTEILHANDYYPFGQVARTHRQGIPEMRFGFNGKEFDGEVKGWQNQVDYGARIYDPRIARWFSLDPLQKKYPNESHYIFTSDNPILYKDADGKDKIITVTVYNKDGTITQIQRVDKGYFEFMIGHMTSLDRNSARHAKLDVYENYIIDLTGSEPQVQYENTFKRRETYSTLLTFYAAKLFSSGDQSSNLKYGLMLFGSAHDMEEQKKLPKAAEGSETLDIDMLISTLEAFRDIPSKKYGYGLTDFLTDKKANKFIERIDNLTKAAQALTNANGGDFPIPGRKELPSDMLNTPNNPTPQIEPSKPKKKVFLFEVDSVPGKNLQPGDKWGKYYGPDKNDTIYKIKERKQ